MAPIRDQDRGTGALSVGWLIRPGHLPIYLGCAYVLGAASLVWVLAGTTWSVPRHAVGMAAVTAVLILVAELLPIRLWIGGAFREYTYSGAFLLALLATGPLAYAVVPQLTALLIVEIRNGKPLRVIAFNVSQYAVMFALAGLAVCAVESGRFGVHEDVSQTRQILGLLIAAPIYFLVNNTMTATVIALVRDLPMVTTVLDTLRKELPITALVLGLAPLIIAGMHFSLLLAPLCLALIVALRHAAKVATTHQVAAVHDALTGLPNRTLMVKRTDEALHDVRRLGGSAALLLIDLDHFKETNDTLGHAVGDELLKAVAGRLSAAISEDALAEHSLPGEVLVIEMTESSLMSDVDRTRAVLSRLRASGVRLSIDDFGTGYSSFTHLRDLPVAEIKIDKSFVSAAPTSSANAAIVKSTIGLAHNLGLAVVAEGVENEHCLDVVTEMGCDIVQGFLLARPMPADEFLDWSASRTLGAALDLEVPMPAGSAHLPERITVPC